MRFLFVQAVLVAALCSGATAAAQRHSLGSSPPTAPPPVPVHPAAPADPFAAVAAGLGPLQFFPVNYGVPAPQSLTRQLQSEDERTRAAALAAIGAPAQYLARGHIPFPHSVRLDLIPLGASDELDGVLTAELDGHMVSAILIPQDGEWRRVASVVFATAFDDASTTPSTFFRTERSLLQHIRYRAVFHGSLELPDGEFMENEMHVGVVDSRAVVTTSFVSTALTCAAPSTPSQGHAGCDLTRRWLQPDASDPLHHFLLVTASGRLPAHDAADPIESTRAFQLSHLRSFSCQPMMFSDASAHFEPSAPAGPCKFH